MGEGLSHWSSMVLRKSQTCFFDRHTHPNSMYSNFCHVLNISTIVQSRIYIIKQINDADNNIMRWIQPFNLNANLQPPLKICSTWPSAQRILPPNWLQDIRPSLRQFHNTRLLILNCAATSLPVRKRCKIKNKHTYIIVILIGYFKLFGVPDFLYTHYILSSKIKTHLFQPQFYLYF